MTSLRHALAAGPALARALFASIASSTALVSTAPVSTVLVSTVLALAPLAAQVTPREGNWEVRMQMEMAALPVKMPETVLTQCVTAEQIKAPASMLPGPSGKPGDTSCKVTDQKWSGSTMTWKMACTAPMDLAGEGTVTFSGDTYTGAVNITTAQGAMAMKYSGKRLGDCQK